MEKSNQEYHTVWQQPWERSALLTAVNLQIAQASQNRTWRCPSQCPNLDPGSSSRMKWWNCLLQAEFVCTFYFSSDAVEAFMIGPPSSRSLKSIFSDWNLPPSFWTWPLCRAGNLQEHCLSLPRSHLRSAKSENRLQNADPRLHN